MLRPPIVIALLCVNAVYSLATPQPRDLIPAVEYTKLLQLCEDGGSNSYVGVRFGADQYTNFDFNQCYPYKIGDNEAQQAVFCMTVTCYNNPNQDCTGGAVPPVPITVPAGLTLVNAVDFVDLLGQGAMCHSNVLS